jgi:hypothetical protein
MTSIKGKVTVVYYVDIDAEVEAFVQENGKDPSPNYLISEIIPTKFEDMQFYEWDDIKVTLVDWEIEQDTLGE